VISIGRTRCSSAKCFVSSPVDLLNSTIPAKGDTAYTASCAKSKFVICRSACFVHTASAMLPKVPCGIWRLPISGRQVDPGAGVGAAAGYVGLYRTILCVCLLAT